MLKFIWTPGAAAAPDSAQYKQANDKLVAEYGNHDAETLIPRDPPESAPDLNELAGVVDAWLAARIVPAAAVKLMLHGYSYDPRHVNDKLYDPFTTIYGYPGERDLNPRLSWLPLGGGVRRGWWAPTGNCDRVRLGRDRIVHRIRQRRLERELPIRLHRPGIPGCHGGCRDTASARRSRGEGRCAGPQPGDTVVHQGCRRSRRERRHGERQSSCSDGAGRFLRADAAATFAGRTFNVVNVTNVVDAY